MSVHVLKSYQDLFSDSLQESNLKSADFIFFENNIEASDEKDFFSEIMSEYFLGKTEPKRKNNVWCICGIISGGFFLAIIIYLVVNMFLLSPKGNFVLLHL